MGEKKQAPESFIYFAQPGSSDEGMLSLYM